MSGIEELVQPDSDKLIACSLQLSDSLGATIDSIRVIPQTGRLDTFALNLTPDLAADAIYFQYRLAVYESSSDDAEPLFEQSSAAVSGAEISVKSSHVGAMVNLDVRGLIETAMGERYYSPWINRQVPTKGENPTLHQVCNTDTPMALLLLGYHYTKLTMFDEDGLPLLSHGGYGLLALSNLATVGRWNWIKHLQIAKTRWLRQESYARIKPRSLRASDPKKYRGLPDFTPHQLMVETLESYNGTSYFEPVRERNGLFKRWVWRRASDTDTFADKVLASRAELERKIGRRFD